MLAMREGVVQKTEKEYFEDLYIVDIEDWIAVIICGFDVTRKGSVIILGESR